MWERYEEGGREEKRRVGGCEEDEMRAARIPDNKKKSYTEESINKLHINARERAEKGEARREKNREN